MTLPKGRCAYCDAEFTPKRRAQRFCSPAHRQAGFRAQFIRRAEKPTWLGKRSEGNRDRRKWYALLKELRSLGYERAREVVRLALADKAVEDELTDMAARVQALRNEGQ